MAVSPPPKKKTVPNSIEQSTKGKKEKEIEEIINRGSTSVKSQPQEPQQIKNFNIKITAGQLLEIDELRAKRPRKPTSPKLAVSLQDWILEAIEEKVIREKRKYSTGS
jgi:hypothetical protein